MQDRENEEVREKFFEDDSLSSFPQESFNLDFQSDRFEIRKVRLVEAQ